MQLIPMVIGKIHRAKVTEANLEYQGSISLSPDLMQAAGILPGQLVHINSMQTAAHWETYAIPGEPGQVCLNGCPARLFRPGDEVIILNVRLMTEDEAKLVGWRWHPVLVDDHNAPITDRAAQLRDKFRPR